MNSSSWGNGHQFPGWGSIVLKKKEKSALRGGGDWSGGSRGKLWVPCYVPPMGSTLWTLTPATCLSPSSLRVPHLLPLPWTWSIHFSRFAWFFHPSGTAMCSISISFKFCSIPTGSWEICIDFPCFTHLSIHHTLTMFWLWLLTEESEALKKSYREKTEEMDMAVSKLNMQLKAAQMELEQTRVTLKSVEGSDGHGNCMCKSVVIILNRIRKPVCFFIF